MSMSNSKNYERLTCGGSVAKLTAADSARPEPPLDTPTSNAAGSMSGPPSPGTVAAEPMASTGHSDEVSTFGAHDSFASVTGQDFAQALLSVDGSADGSMPMAAPTMSSMDINSTLSAIPADLPIDMMDIDEDADIAPASLMGDGIPRNNRSEQRQWLVSPANDVFMGHVEQSTQVSDLAQGFMPTPSNVPLEGLEQAPQAPVPESADFMVMDSEVAQGLPTSNIEMEPLCFDMHDQDCINSPNTTPILLSQGSNLLGGATTPSYPPPYGPQHIEPYYANNAVNAYLQTCMSSTYPTSFVFSPASTVCPADVMLESFNSAGLDSEAMRGSTMRSMTHGIATGSTYGAAIDEMGGENNGEEFNADCEDLDDEEEDEGTDGDYHDDDDDDDDEDSNGPDYGGSAATWKGKTRKDEPRSCPQYTGAEYLVTPAKDLYINDRFDRRYDSGSHTLATHSSAGASPSSDSSAPRYRCPVPGCTLDYSTKWNINDHISRHHSDANTIKCDEAGCEMVFKVRRDMIRHVNECHKGIKPHMCPKCPMAFKRRYKMIKHFEKEHPGEPLPFKKTSKECDE